MSGIIQGTRDTAMNRAEKSPLSWFILSCEETDKSIKIKLKISESRSCSFGRLLCGHDAWLVPE